MIALTALIAGGGIFFAAVFTPSWLLDRLCARWYGGLTGSQLVSRRRVSAEGERLWHAVTGADTACLPPSCDPYVVRNPQRGGAT